MDRNRLDPYGWEPEPLNGPALLPSVMPREMRMPPLGQSNLLNRLMSSFGQEAADATRDAIAGRKTPAETAWTYLTAGPMGPFGGMRVPRPATQALERPIRAAVDMRGQVFDGIHHGDAYVRGLSRLGHVPDDEIVHGFVTNRGRFVNREQANRLASTLGYDSGSAELVAGDLDAMARQTKGGNGPPRVPNPIRAYHGSPHDFDEFRMDRIGTGEGAQAYGHGLYFAEREGIARHYRDALSARIPPNGPIPAPISAREIAEDALRPGHAYLQNEAPRDAALRRLDRRITVYEQTSPNLTDRLFRRSQINEDADQLARLREARRLIDSNEVEFRPSGRMYEVNLHARPEQFLDWDRPLAGQSDAVRNWYNARVAPGLRTREIGNNPNLGPLHDVLHPEGGSIGAFTPDRLPEVLNNPAGFVPTTGADIARQRLEGSLSEAGIPGIRYLDQGSRNTGQGTSNYVVFSPEIIEILRKYGIAGPVAAPVAANALAGEPQ